MAASLINCRIYSQLVRPIGVRRLRVLSHGDSIRRQCPDKSCDSPAKQFSGRPTFYRKG